MQAHAFPPTLQPFLANSTASWWNKRWDIAAGNTLRAVVFDPICEGRWVHDRKVAPARPSPLRQLLGSCASFTTSGLIHEGIYWWVQLRLQSPTALCWPFCSARNRHPGAAVPHPTEMPPHAGCNWAGV